jgi:Ca2+-binding EF-hand superfamily protein
VEAVFNTIDTNGSGKLSRGELGEAMAKLGYELLSSELDVLFGHFDRNGDGVVSKKEFLDRIVAVSSAPPPAPAPTPAPEPPAKSKQAIHAAERDLARLIGRLSRALGASGRDAIDAVFNAIDSNGSGNLSRTELGEALAKLGYDLLTSELDVLFGHFDRNGDGVVSKKEFLDRIVTVTAAPPAPPPPPPPAPEPPAKSREAVLAAERDLARLIARVSRAVGSSGRAAVDAVFNAIDTNGSGSLTRGELSEALARLGYDLLTSELDVLFGHFDRNGDGVVSKKEFLDRIVAVVAAPPPAPAPPPPPRAVVNAERGLADLVSRLQRNVGPRGRDAVRTVFNAIDTNGNGRLSREELGVAMVRLGYGLLASELDLLFSRFDKDGSGSVSLAEFTDAVCGPPPPPPPPPAAIPEAVAADLAALDPEFFDEVEELKFRCGPLVV